MTLLKQNYSLTANYKIEAIKCVACVLLIVKRLKLLIIEIMTKNWSHMNEVLLDTNIRTFSNLWI